MLERRLLLVTGKGGVGRSAVAAGLAIRAARHGKKVLAIAMTDWIGLASHFGVEHLTYRPVEVRAGVYASVVERTAALDEYLHLQLHAPRVAPLSPLARGLGLLAETVPGVRDIITMGKVVYDVKNGDWDLVVADTPPTGQLISYLRAPATIAGLVPTGRIREQAAWMQAAIEDPAVTGVVMVALAEELPVTETMEALAAIEGSKLADVAAVVVNRLLPPLGVSDETVDGLPDGPHRRAAVLHRGLRASQQRWLRELPPAVKVPHLFGVLTPGEVAARMADELVVS